MTSITDTSQVPLYIQSLINSVPGSIKRRYPTFWSDNEGGIDFSAPQGTPIVALADGPIVGAGAFCNAQGNWHIPVAQSRTACGRGVVTQDVTNQDGTHTYLYYQHIFVNPAIQSCWNGAASCGGQTIHKGDTIGWISDFGMMEMGVNVGNATNVGASGHAGWGGIWGADPNPGPHVDPEGYIRSLVATGGFPPGIPGSSFGSVGGLFDFAAIAPQLKSWGEYAAIFILALVFVFIGFYLLGGHPVESIQNAVAAPVNYVQTRRAVLKAGANGDI